MDDDPVVNEGRPEGRPEGVNPLVAAHLARRAGDPNGTTSDQRVDPIFNPAELFRPEFIAVDALEPPRVARRRPQELKGFKGIRVVPSLAQPMNHPRSGRPRFHFSTSLTRYSTVIFLSL